MSRSRMGITFLLVFGTMAYADVTPIFTVGATGPLYVSGINDRDVFAVDVQNATYTTVGTISSAGLIFQITLLDRQTALVADPLDNNLYAMNLQTGSFAVNQTFPVSGIPEAVDILNATTGFAVGGSNVYQFNPQNSSNSFFANIPGSNNLLGIAIRDSSSAYIIGSSTNALYFLNLMTGLSNVLVSFPFAFHPTSIRLANRDTAFVTELSGTIYQVDLNTGAFNPVNTTSFGNDNAYGSALNGNIIYPVDANTNDVYAVNILNGTVTTILNIAGFPGLQGDAFFPQILTTGLTANNLAFANYLNANAPSYVIRSFALQGTNLGESLESAAPTRNAFLTFASQNGYLASSQVLIDHSRQKRFHYQSGLPSLVACTKEGILKQYVCNSWNVWATPFGEYARERPQHQTPKFKMAVGGALLGADYNYPNSNLVGLAGSYVFTHLKEESEGKASINQGFLSVYSTLNWEDFYTDFSLWGGYYRGSNHRYISFPGVSETALAKISGWQTSGHFEFGYNNSTNWFGLEPFIMGDWVGNWEGSFFEHGAGDYNMGQKDRFCSFLRAESGLRFHQVIEFECGNRLVIREKGSYAYQKAFNTGRITAFLIGSPGSFTVDTLTGSQNLGVFEFLALYNTISGAYTELRYQGEFGSNYLSNQAMLEIGYNF